MANSNNNSVIPTAGSVSLDTVFDFFRIAPENREYFIEIMKDFVGMYSTIDWETDRYHTTRTILVPTKRDPKYNIIPDELLNNYNPSTNINKDYIDGRIENIHNSPRYKHNPSYYKNQLNQLKIHNTTKSFSNIFM